MKDETSIFGAKPERLDRLVFEALQDSEAEESVPTASLGAVLERPGGQIGRYKLLSVLGEGGMGMVYLAEQEGQIRRKVALKVIKPGMDSKRIIARFETERQALALLDHPNIAQVYDAGTTESGRPYFVMEHVKGSPITEYCDRHKLNIEDRLILFQEVCAGLQHAHQKGIIHRDIKPSNILVSAGGDKAVPKIIDFGVAKAIAAPLTERTLFTEDSQLLGTPEYMSPEQADMASEDIDTRSDIYSLGVLLYILLAGILPYDSKTFREGGVEHIRRIIRETDPKTPSTRLTKLGKEARKLAENRRTEIGILAKNLRRELEWIPLKAMRKDRAERYRSASELADDIENYLNGAPLIAGPPGAGYKMKKFVRRNKMLVSGVVAVLIVLLMGVIISSVLAIGQARALAENQLITDFLENDVLGSIDKAGIDEATVEYTLDAASKTLEIRFKDKPLIKASLCQTLGEIYRKLGEYEKAEQHLLRATEIYEKHLGEEHPDTLRASSNIGWIYYKQGRYHDMERLWSRILPIEQRVSDAERQVYTMNGLAVTYYHLGRYTEAESLFKKALELIRRELDEEDFWQTPSIKYNLVRVYIAQGQYEEAERLVMKTLANDRLTVDRFGTALATIYQAQGQYAKVEPLFVKALEKVRQLRGDEHHDTLSRSYDLVQFYVDQNRYEEAESLFSKALPIARRLLREDHPLTLRLVNARAVLYTKQKQYDQAEILFEAVLKGRQRELGDDHPETLETINDLGILHRQQKHYEQAEKLLTEALEGRKNKLGADHPAYFESIHELALVYKEQARYEEAESLLLKALEGRRLKLGDTHPNTLESQNCLINLYEAWGKAEEANQWRARLP